MIQWNIAFDLSGESSYVAYGKQRHVSPLEVQLSDSASRKVVSEYEPAGKGPFGAGPEGGGDDEEVSGL